MEGSFACFVYANMISVNLLCFFTQQECGVFLSPHSEMQLLFFLSSAILSIHSAMDAFAQTLMKDAVNCDKHSDLQNSVNQLDFEYGLCCRGCLCKHTFSIYPLLCTSPLFVNCKAVLVVHLTSFLDDPMKGPSQKVCVFLPAPFVQGGPMLWLCHTAIMM